MGQFPRDKCVQPERLSLLRAPAQFLLSRSQRLAQTIEPEQRKRSQVIQSPHGLSFALDRF
jgi:hypothetical protein